MPVKVWKVEGGIKTTLLHDATMEIPFTLMHWERDAKLDIPIVNDGILFEVG